MKKAISEIFDELESIYSKYSKELRAGTQPFILEKVKNKFPEYEYNINDEVIRETLIEHVGSLPIVMSFLYPYIEDDSVDLGHALLLSSIHDIGEIVVGDDFTFTKEESSKTEEMEAGLNILHPMYHDFYVEMENKTSVTAQYAKSVDKFTGDLLDLLSPAEITIKKYNEKMNLEPSEISGLFKEHKHPYMIWNKFMTEMHLELLDRLHKKVTK